MFGQRIMWQPLILAFGSQTNSSDRRTYMKFAIVTSFILLTLLMIFAVQNAALVQIRFLLWEFEFPRSLLIFLTLLIGIVIGWLTTTAIRHRNK